MQKRQIVQKCDVSFMSCTLTPVALHFSRLTLAYKIRRIRAMSGSRSYGSQIKKDAFAASNFSARLTELVAGSAVMDVTKQLARMGNEQRSAVHVLRAAVGANHTLIGLKNTRIIPTQLIFEGTPTGSLIPATPLPVPHSSTYRTLFVSPCVCMACLVHFL